MTTVYSQAGVVRDVHSSIHTPFHPSVYSSLHPSIHSPTHPFNNNSLSLQCGISYVSTHKCIECWVYKHKVWWWLAILFYSSFWGVNVAEKSIIGCLNTKSLGVPISKLTWINLVEGNKKQKTKNKCVSGQVARLVRALSRYTKVADSISGPSAWKKQPVNS